MIVKNEDILNLSHDEIQQMELSTLRFYLKKVMPNYCQIIDEVVEIGSSYISHIMSGRRKGKVYRSTVDAKARELLQTYVKKAKLKNQNQPQLIT